VRARPLGPPARRRLALLGLVLATAGCGGDDAEPEWAQPNADLASTRVARDAEIDAGNVATLRPAWRYRLPGEPGITGLYASTPLAAEGRVYLQTLRSDVAALDLETGRELWLRRFDAPNTGPNGIAYADGVVYGATDTRAFAISAETGRDRWLHVLINRFEQFVQIAPVVSEEVVLTSTVGFPPGGKGTLYALDRANGRERWRFVTVAEPWRFPDEAGGGGAWQPLTVDGDGRVYAGIANPAPWGGTPAFPDGGAFPGPARWTSSLVALEEGSGRLAWADQVTPHDTRDYDFQNSPVVVDDLVVGSGKAGVVIAWDRESGGRAWERKVGLHANDEGPLPDRRRRICPGLLGGVETPLAVADGRVFVPVVDLCVSGSATDYDRLDDVDAAAGTGRLVALDLDSGEPLWERRLPSPVFSCATVANDVVLTADYDGTVYAFATEDGRELWRTRLRARTNACPAVVGDTLLVGAGVPRGPGSVLELVAYRVPD
jgi:alcohol dehydrogenase (cytochrome c)